MVASFRFTLWSCYLWCLVVSTAFPNFFYQGIFSVGKSALGANFTHSTRLALYHVHESHRRSVTSDNARLVDVRTDATQDASGVNKQQPSLPTNTSRTHTHTHAQTPHHTHTHTHARARAHAPQNHKHTHTHACTNTTPHHTHTHTHTH